MFIHLKIYSGKSWQKCRPPRTLRKNLFCTTKIEKTSEQVVIAAVIFLANILVIAHATRDPYNVRKVISWTTPTRMFSEY